MNLKQFTKDAIRTESIIDELQVNEELLNNVLNLYINSGQMLDQIKKHGFYGSDYKIDKLRENITNIRRSSEALCVMDTQSIQNWSEQTIVINPRVAHGLIGCMTESVELGEAFQAIQAGNQDTINIGEEIGDTSWYQAILIDALELEWDNVLNNVINKLKNRYPEKFTQECAENRDLDTERKILSQ